MIAKNYSGTVKSDASILLLANVTLDMVNAKLKLFEILGNNVDERLVQKMTYYNTYGIEILEQLNPGDTQSKIHQTRKVTNYYTDPEFSF